MMSTKEHGILRALTQKNCDLRPLHLPSRWADDRPAWERCAFTGCRASQSASRRGRCQTEALEHDRKWGQLV